MSVNHALRKLGTWRSRKSRSNFTSEWYVYQAVDLDNRTIMAEGQAATEAEADRLLRNALRNLGWEPKLIDEFMFDED